jgi:hypothetical protein
MTVWSEPDAPTRREVRHDSWQLPTLVAGTATTAERLATNFALGLALARVVVGFAEVVFPRLFLRFLGKPGTATEGAALGFRMKGGRDLGVGLVTLGAAMHGDRGAVAQLTATGVIIDAVDGLAVHRAGPDVLRRPLYPLGAYGGYAVGIASGAAAFILGREDS